MYLDLVPIQGSPWIGPNNSMRNPFQHQDNHFRDSNINQISIIPYSFPTFIFILPFKQEMNTWLSPTAISNFWTLCLNHLLVLKPRHLCLNRKETIIDSYGDIEFLNIRFESSVGSQVPPSLPSSQFTNPLPAKGNCSAEKDVDNEAHQWQKQ